MGSDDRHASSSLVVSSRDVFDGMVTEAMEKRNLKTLPLVKSYLVDLLSFYIHADNLYDLKDTSGRKTRSTLAETVLKAQSADTLVRIELLKRVGDQSLYVSGFFGDSLQRKLVDVDYYADMGGMAYGALAESVREDTLARVYREFARRFVEFVDVLSLISTQAHVTNEENILRLYESYALTGSESAREKLNERGLIAVPVNNLRSKKRN